jgi:hypothetical protein
MIFVIVWMLPVFEVRPRGTSRLSSELRYFCSRSSRAMTDFAKIVKLVGAAEAAFPTFAPAASDHIPHLRMDGNDALGGRTTIRLRGRSVQTTVIPTAISGAITSLMDEVQSYVRDSVISREHLSNSFP